MIYLSKKTQNVEDLRPSKDVTFRELLFLTRKMLSRDLKMAESFQTKVSLLNKLHAWKSYCDKYSFFQNIAIHPVAAGLWRSRRIHLCLLCSIVKKIGSCLHIYIKTHNNSFVVNELYTYLRKPRT